MTQRTHHTGHIREISLMVIALVVGINLGSKEIDSWLGHPQQQAESDFKISIETCFTPHQKCMPKIIQHIGAARESIFMRMYAFTSKEVADALIRAHQRGVQVVVLCDKGQAKQQHSQEKRLKGQGIPVVYESVKGYAHNKVMIIDRRLVLTGSYNYTAGAEHRNAENLLIIQDSNVVERYLQDFQRAYTVQSE